MCHQRIITCCGALTSRQYCLSAQAGAEQMQHRDTHQYACGDTKGLHHDLQEQALHSQCVQSPCTFHLPQSDTVPAVYPACRPVHRADALVNQLPHLGGTQLVSGRSYPDHALEIGAASSHDSRAEKATSGVRYCTRHMHGTPVELVAGSLRPALHSMSGRCMAEYGPQSTHHCELRNLCRGLTMSELARATIEATQRSGPMRQSRNSHLRHFALSCMSSLVLIQAVAIRQTTMALLSATPLQWNGSALLGLRQDAAGLQHLPSLGRI